MGMGINIIIPNPKNFVVKKVNIVPNDYSHRVP